MHARTLKKSLSNVERVGKPTLASDNFLYRSRRHPLTLHSDTLIRHAKSHYVNRSGKMTLLEALKNLGEDGAVHDEEQSAGNCRQF